MRAAYISADSLAGLVADLRASAARVVAPARAADGGVDYRPIERLEEAELNGAVPRRSLKELFLPPTEPLLTWKQSGSAVELSEVPVEFPPQVVLGARPCDAAAVATLDRVMDWDYHDELWFGRRAATTMVSLLCTTPDETCFCTAVGLGPDAGKGSDLLLLPVDGGFLAEVLTDKGEALVAAHKDRFAEPGGRVRPEALVEDMRAKVAANLAVPMAPITAWLEANFKDPLWEGIAVRCNGCGACAAICPTCHCFDIVDEPEGVTHGVRRRNWDTCQTARFTVHASGHNPRDGQNARFRQRVMHKFFIYPAKFGELLCSGCGRCARACPGGQDILETLGRIAALAAGKREATA